MAQCIASCEANCDGECDIKCAPVVDGDCYTHCIECCGGSCGAQANMDCQTTCQDKEFETCERELKVSCNGSCSGSGAIFCGGNYVLSGDQIPACIRALAAQGIATKDLRVSGSVNLSDAGGKGCAVAPGESNWFPWLAFGVVVPWVVRRRRQAARRA